MPNYSIPNFSNASIGMEDLFIQGGSILPQLMASLMFFIYVFILGVGFAIQERKTGFGNFWLWSTIAGLMSSILGFILLLNDGLFSQLLLNSVIITLLVTISSGIIFFVSERD